MFFVCILFSVISLNAQISQHGLILTSGLGSVNAQSDKWSLAWDEIEYKFGLSAGYRLRFNIPAPNSFHYDMDVKVGSSILMTMCNQQFDTGVDGLWGYFGQGSYWLNSNISIGGTASYTFFKNFSAGLGIEPSYYFRPSGGYMKNENKFDIPIAAKIACNLKGAEIGIYGKYGLMNVLEAEHVKSGKIREIQLSVFIPFYSSHRKN